MGAAVAMVAAGLSVAPASACGGFFCNGQSMDQAGEEILFGVDSEAGTVEAQIRIFYQGEAEDFGWILPVPTAPELDTGSDMVFERLKAATQPTFRLDWKEGSTCGEIDDYRQFYGEGSEGGEEGGDDGAEFEEPGQAVTVLDSGLVGAFEFATLSSTDASELVDWLNDNGFVQPDSSAALIDHYLQADMLFVALKLQQRKGAGDITPVVLRFTEQAPCVPLVLTQIAARNDMPVQLWVAAKARAVPNNWFEVQPNLQHIPWLDSWGGPYWGWDQLVTDAINEAAGRAFVTEYAGSTDILASTLFNPSEFDTEALAAAPTAVDFVEEIQSQFQFGSPTLLNLLREAIPMPDSALEDGIDENQFYSWPWDYSEYYAEIEYDGQTAAQVVIDRVVEPLEKAQALVDGYSTLTKLYTTVSPDEMTRDPLFRFNPTLPEVPLERVAEGEMLCDGDTWTGVTITLADGTVFRPELGWGFETPSGYEPDDLTAAPFASEVRLLPESGAAFVVTPEDVEFADDQLNTLSAELVIEQLGGPEASAEGGAEAGGESGSGTGSESSDRGGCSQASGAAGATALFGCLFLILIARRVRE